MDNPTSTKVGLDALLTPENCVVLLIDHQPSQLANVNSHDPTMIIDAAALNRREIDLAGDVRTMPEAARILTEALGRPIAFAQTPIEQVRRYSADTALMLEWFERVGYSADIPGLEREFGRSLTKLPDWARGQTRGALA